MKTVYAFHPATRVYVGPVQLDDSDRSPLEPSKWIVPGDCLDVGPGDVPAGKEAVAGATSWALRDIAVAPDPGSVVPASVTMRQARLALLAIGKLDAVAAAIAGMPSPERERAQIEWEYATTVERSSALLAQLAAPLQLDVDSLFKAAVTL